MSQTGNDQTTLVDDMFKYSNLDTKEQVMMKEVLDQLDPEDRENNYI